MQSYSKSSPLAGVKANPSDTSPATSKLTLVASFEQMNDRKGMKSSTISTLTNELSSY
jgi:hypothetical protein